jgi:hypothetical protein
MTPSPDDPHLLADVLGEGLSPDARSTLLHDTLRLARRRRVVRRARRTSLVLAAAGCLALLSWQALRTTPSQPTTLVVTSVPSCETVRTAPLPVSTVVTTRAFVPVAVVHSARGDDVAVVETLPGRGFRLINDDELLALAAPQKPALMRTGPHAQELIFLAPNTEPRN